MSFLRRRRIPGPPAEQSQEPPVKSSILSLKTRLLMLLVTTTCLGTQAVRTEGPIPSPYLFTGINGDSVKSKFLSVQGRSKGAVGLRAPAFICHLSTSLP